MAEKMRRAPTEAFQGGGPLSDTLRGGSVSAPIADQQLERMNSHAASLRLPPMQYDPVPMMDSEYVTGMESYLDAGIPEFHEMALMDPMMAEELFIPNAFDDSFFADDPEFQETFGNDKDFEEFLKGKRKEYSSKEEKKKKWLQKKEKELKENGIVIRVNPDGSVTVTSSKYSASKTTPIIAGKAFKKFMEGKAPTYSGSGKATAQWLAQNASRLAKRGIDVQVEGERYLLTNTKFRKAPLNIRLFAGSGFGGPEFRAFLNGESARLEGHKDVYASWLMRNMNRLRAAGLDVHVELNNQGNPTGRYVIQNPKMMAQLIGKGERKAILNVLKQAQRHYAIAKKFLKAARAMKAKGPADFGKTKRYAKLALLNLDKARRLFTSAARYYSLSRLLYAKRTELARHPAKTLLSGLLSRAQKLLNVNVSPKMSAQALAKAQFLLAFVNTTLFARKIGNTLNKTTQREIDSRLSSALHLFELGTPASLGKAGLMLSTVKSFVSLSVQHSSARITFKNLKNIKYPANVEHMPIFQTNQRFDIRKFERLTGVSYKDYSKGTPRTKAGVATVLGSIYLKSMQHYSRSLKAYRSALDGMSKNKPVDSAMVKGISLAQKEHALGAIEHSRASQLQPLFQAAAKLYEAIISVPLKDESMKKGLDGLGSAGMKEIKAARDNAWFKYRNALAYLSRGMFGLLAAQNSEGSERAAMLKSSKTNLGIAASKNQEMLSAINTYHDLHARTRFVVSYLKTMAKTGVDDTVFGQSTILAMKDHLGKVRKPFAMTNLQLMVHAFLKGEKLSRDQKLLRSVFLKTITNPYLLRDMPLPRKKEVLAHMNRLGMSFFETLHQESPDSAEVKKEVRKMLAKKIQIRVAHIGNETGTTKKIASFTYEKVTLRSHLKSRFQDIYKKLIQLENNPNSMTTEQRRELLLTILKLPKDYSASEAMKRVVNTLHLSIAKSFASYFTAYIKMLEKRAGDMPKLGKAIGADANYLLENLRPTQINIMSTHSGTEFSLRNKDQSSALTRLRNNAADAASVGEQMKQVLPDIMLSFYKNSAKLADKVGRLEVYNQIKIDRAREERKAVAIVAVAAALIAAPFTGGMSLGAAAGLVFTGVGFGVAAVSLPLSVDNYNFIKNHPMSTDKELKNARKRLIYDSISFGTSLIPVGGAALRSWAIGRGSMRLAQLSLAAEAASAGWGVYLGAKGVYSGVQAFKKGDYAAGFLGATLGGLGVVGGGMGVFQSVSAIRALGRLGVSGKNPAELAKNLNQKLAQSVSDIEDGMNVFRQMSAGKDVSMTPQMAVKFRNAVKFVTDYAKIGGKVPEGVRKSLTDFNRAMFVQPAEDVRVIGSLISSQKNNALITPKNLSKALEARTNLMRLSQFRSLTPKEQLALEGLNRTAASIAKKDLAALTAKMPRNPTEVQILTASTARQRLLSIYDAGLSGKVPAHLTSWRTTMQIKLSNPVSLRSFASRLQSRQAGTRMQAEAELSILPKSIREHVQTFSRASIANPQGAKALASEYSSKIGKAYSSELGGHISSVSDFVSKASKPGLKLSHNSSLRIRAAGRALRDHVQGGGKLTPEQRKAYDAFRRITVTEPTRNIELLKRSMKSLSSPGDAIQAAAIRARIEKVRGAAPLSSGQLATVRSFDAAAVKQSARDHKLLESLSSKTTVLTLPELKDAIEAQKRIEALDGVPGVAKNLLILKRFNVKLEKAADEEIVLLGKFLSEATAQRLKMAERAKEARKKLAMIAAVLKLTPEQKKIISKYDAFSA